MNSTLIFICVAQIIAFTVLITLSVKKYKAWKYMKRRNNMRLIRGGIKDKVGNFYD
jgi:hypothetical protein